MNPKMLVLKQNLDAMCEAADLLDRIDALEAVARAADRVADREDLWALEDALRALQEVPRGE